MALWASTVIGLLQDCFGSLTSSAPQGAEFTFLIALLGWMPSAVDLSPWVSIWTLERYRQTGYTPRLRSALREFNLGYAFCVVLALCFLLLGALLLRTHDMALPSGTAAFAAGIIGLYTEVLGPWSAPFVGSAAFAAMLGTCIACLDGFSRSFTRQSSNATCVIFDVWCLGSVSFVSCRNFVYGGLRQLLSWTLSVAGQRLSGSTDFPYTQA